MPVTPTYPGVYVQEIPSGVHTITGVATSITAFIGRAQRGPVNEPVTINSYADFERVFGGLWVESSLGYAVRDFYLNGGSRAIIVRLFNPPGPSQAERTKAKDAADAAATVAQAAKDAKLKADIAKDARAEADKHKDKEATVAGAADQVAKAVENLGSKATVDELKAAAEKAAKDVAQAIERPSVAKAQGNIGGLGLEARSEGTWGNAVKVTLDNDVIEELKKKGFFNLTVTDAGTGAVEVFRNLSVDPSDPRAVDKVLENQSKLLRASAGALPAAISFSTADPADDKNGGSDAKQENTSSAGKASGANPEEGAVKTVSGTLSNGSDGVALDSNSFTGNGLAAKKQGLYALEKADLFNLLCIPPYNAHGNVDDGVLTAADEYCVKRRAMLIVDPPAGWMDKDAAKSGISGVPAKSGNSAIFFPRLRGPNPQRGNQVEDFAPCGAVAGVMARTDGQRGVWKAPAGMDATLNGVSQLSVPLTDLENGELNPLGINCLRVMPAVGPVVWGARTRQGDDRLASEWKYIPVRRLALFIEESLYRGTQWVVFEPNDEPLWAQIRLNVGAFMHDLFRKGAFQGRTPREAYFVKCDSETTTQTDIDNGIVNIIVGFAPLKPAEFVIISLQQMAGQIQA